MKSSISDEVEGKYHKAKGKVKETSGKLTGDRDLEAEGSAEKTEGEIQEKKGQIKKVFGK
ncbi:CsbD family protein [Methanosarcina spelaei]|uniref:CsbD family protein n=1 Tax=Methanosarcina spelaei TaxID=1036679 RepID=A0A2A2HP07_9EURY|nr:CsbD family protein [Methanosarcina spelaei]PAV11221.1 CsbD family protein [Methanosarcina spelaei]